MPRGAVCGASAAGATGSASAWATPRRSASSPVSYISVTMSQPPTSSPSTKSCGIVGQLETADSSWRMRGSGRTSTAAYGLPSASSAAAVRAEKPHIGRSGVPFMKRMTSCSEIASPMASRISFSLVSLTWSSLRSGFEGQCVDGAADLGAEHRVDAPVLLDPAHGGELRGDHLRPEVIAAAREVGDVHAGIRNGSLDALLELVGTRHTTSVATATLREALDR